MSYTVDGDGKVTFRCQGKECGKTKESRSLKVLPKKWCLSAVLVSEDSPEFVSTEAQNAYQQKTQERLLEANQQLAGHFCSFKCAKKSFSDERVVAMVKKLKVAVVVYGDCKLVVDAENMDDGDGRDGDEAPLRAGPMAARGTTRTTRRAALRPRGSTSRARPRPSRCRRAALRGSRRRQKKAHGERAVGQG